MVLQEDGLNLNLADVPYHYMPLGYFTQCPHFQNEGFSKTHLLVASLRNRAGSGHKSQGTDFIHVLHYLYEFFVISL